jgi:hypothetical protein
LRPLELKNTLQSLIDSKIPTFIWGSPGIGKSSIIKQIAKEKNLEFIDLRLSLLDPTDLKGIPFFNSSSNEAVWAQPNFLPKDDSASGVLFLDEINSAPPSVQAAAYQLVLDRKIGDYILPDNWAIVAAGNLETDRAVVYKMPSPLANRFIHLTLDISFNDWKSWAYNNSIDSTIIAFLNNKQEYLFNFDATKNEKAFATPRSWEYVDSILKANISANTLLETIQGAIGTDIAIEFINFKKVITKLPNIDDILNAKKVELTDDSEVLFALISALVSRVKKSTKEQVDNAIRFSLKLPSEFSVMFIKDMQQANITIEECAAWEDWVEKFAYLLE